MKETTTAFNNAKTELGNAVGAQELLANRAMKRPRARCKRQTAAR